MNTASRMESTGVPGRPRVWTGSVELVWELAYEASRTESSGVPGTGFGVAGGSVCFVMLIRAHSSRVCACACLQARYTSLPRLSR